MTPNTTLSEIVAKSATSRMQVFCDELVQQSEEARSLGWMWMAARRKRWWLVQLLKNHRNSYRFVAQWLIEWQHSSCLGFMCPVISTFQVVWTCWRHRFQGSVTSALPQTVEASRRSNSGTCILYCDRSLSNSARYSETRHLHDLLWCYDYDTSLIVAGIDSLRHRREKLTARLSDRSSPAAHISTVCFLIVVTMTLLSAAKS